MNVNLWLMQTICYFSLKFKTPKTQILCQVSSAMISFQHLSKGLVLWQKTPLQTPVRVNLDFTFYIVANDIW